MAVARNGDVWLRFEDLGPRDGEPLLLVMGLGASARPWWRLLPHLVPTVRCVVFDNRGTGESDRVRGRLTMADLSGDARAVLDAAGIDRAHVLGVSLGGMVAQHLALEHPDRVASLVLACTTPTGRRGGPPWRLLAASALRPILGPGRTWPVIAPAMYGPATRESAPERIAEDLRVREADATPAATIYAQIAAVAAHDTTDRLADLGRLGVTVVHGEDDGLVLPDRGRELAAAIPGARLVMIPACGHMLTTDAEATTAATVLEHVRWHAPASSGSRSSQASRPSRPSPCPRPSSATAPATQSTAAST